MLNLLLIKKEKERGYSIMKEFFILEMDDEWYNKFAENFKYNYDREPIPKNANELIDSCPRASDEEKVIIINCLIGHDICKGDVQFIKESYEVGQTIIECKWCDVIADFGVDDSGINFYFARNNERMRFYLDSIHIFCDKEGVVIEFTAKHIASVGLFVVK